MDERTEYEKLVANISQFAVVVRTYYNALVEAGFSRKDAMLLSSQYQKEILGLAKSNNDKPNEL